MRKRDPQLQEDGFHLLLPYAAAHVDELIVDFQNETDHGLRCWFLELIGTARDPKAFGLLVTQLSSSDEAMRSWAARGLEGMDTPAARQALRNAGVVHGRRASSSSLTKPVDGEAWGRQDRAQLMRWLPAEVVGSQRALNYVLLHGDDHLGSRWTPEWLAPVEAAAFLAFLETKFSDENGYEIFGQLRRRAMSQVI
ncbi:MAG: hypothetical protein K0R38_6915 [Polyangiaceae bacterium]|jgi:hypothetical protein|nr:hypothetical protein [Polyangiaceae bacterium]